jgi:hypothetical protein
MDKDLAMIIPGFLTLAMIIPGFLTLAMCSEETCIQIVLSFYTVFPMN